MNANWLDWVAVAVIGGVVGVSELISRYKDDPWLHQSWPAAFYLAINSAASVGALLLMPTVGWAYRAKCGSSWRASARWLFPDVALRGSGR